MNKTIAVTTLGLLSLLISNTASAQFIDIKIGFPAPPPLVVVTPGVQVVEDYDEEVFFVDGWYWLRRDARWYRTRHHHGGWAVVEHRHVPGRLVHLAPGRYRHFKKHHNHRPVEARHVEHDQRYKHKGHKNEWGHRRGHEGHGNDDRGKGGHGRGGHGNGNGGHGKKGKH